MCKVGHTYFFFALFKGGRKAIELAPDDSRAHFSLGIALARAGRKDEARREFETVIETAKSNPSLFRNVEVRAQQEIKRLAGN